MVENHHHDREPPPVGGLGRVWAAAAVLFALVLSHWRLTLTSQFDWRPAGAGGVGFMAAEWHRGRLALWWPGPGLGVDLFAVPGVGAAAPWSWVAASLPLVGGQVAAAVFNWTFVILHLAGAAGAYRLARALGAGRWGGVVAGVAFPLTGVFGATMELSALGSMAMAPWVGWGLARVRQGAGWRVAALGGAALGLAWLGGDTITAAVLSLGAACACGAIRLDRRACVVFFSMALVAGALQIVPAVAAGTLLAQAVERESLASLRGLVLPHLGAAWVGVCVAVLAVMGLRRRPLLAAFALAGMMVAVWAPGAGLMLFGLGAALAAGFGMEAWLEAPDGPMARWLMLAALAFGLSLSVYQFYLIEANLFPGSVEQRPMAIAAVSLLLAALMGGVRAGTVSGRAAAVCVLGLMLTEVGVRGPVTGPAMEVAKSEAGSRIWVERAGACAAGDSVAMESFAPNRLRVRARMSCAGVVVMDEAWRPGWRVKANGEGRAVVERQGRRAVALEAGAWVVEFYYRPVLTLASAGATGLALLGLPVLAWGARRRR